MRDWALRETASGLRAAYFHDGHWTDDTLGTLVAHGLGQRPELELRVWSGTRPSRHSMAELTDAARAFATGLMSRGIGPGDVVAFQLPNWVEASITFYGAALVGVVLVPVVHFYGPKELAYILRETRARALITTERFGHVDYIAGIEALWPSLPELELVAVVGDVVPKGAVRFDRLLADLDDGLVLPTPVDPDAPAVVGYTSGTTANPKGVVHSHRSLNAEMRQITVMSGPAERPMLVGAPVGHAIGMQAGLLAPLVRGMAIHLMDVWHPPTALAIMLEAGLTAGSGSTYFLTSLLDAPECTPRHHELMGHIGLGGSPVPAAVADRAEALGITITRSYGSTEHPSTTGSTRDAPRAQRCYTDGPPRPGVEVRLVDDAGRDVALGTPGEILSRGPDLCPGYTDPALTADAFDEDGWFASGDIGVLDTDGCITITDRKKDIIIRGGENISAAEIEELLVRLPGVSEVAVVAAPDERLGEHACAFLRMQPGAPVPDLDGVRAHLEAAGLSRQKWPEEVRALDEFPRTPSGKVQKYVLREQARAAAR